ncbi:MAG: putative heme iron utilization protein [Pseudohongiellaceae bacterium]|jgi:putative heme iron utilization protein
MMNKKTVAAKEARNLMLNEYQGVLSTHSVDVPGFPFGSVVPYCLDRMGRPVILISRIAQHTKNIQADDKVSLIVAESGADDIQANGRVTYLGYAQQVLDNDQDTVDRYYKYYPDAIDYHKAHDFDLFYIELHRLRFIGGFGQIYWIDTDSYLRTNPFTAGEEKGAVEHMNEDHVSAIRHYCSLASIPLKDDDFPEMSGVDGEGFHIRIGQRIHRFHFDAPIVTTTQLRQKLTELAHQSA